MFMVASSPVNEVLLASARCHEASMLPAPPIGADRPTMYEFDLKSLATALLRKLLAAGLPPPKALSDRPVNQPSRVCP